MDALFLGGMLFFAVSMLLARILDPSLFRVGSVQPGVLRRAAVMFVASLVLISAYLAVLILVGRPWSAIIAMTSLLVSGAAGVYSAWQRKRKRERTGAPQSP